MTNLPAESPVEIMRGSSQPRSDRLRGFAIVALSLMAPVLYLAPMGSSNVNICLADPVVLVLLAWMGVRFLRKGLRLPLAPVFLAMCAAMILSVIANAGLSLEYRSPFGLVIVIVKAMFPWTYFYVAVNLIRTRAQLLLSVKVWVLASAAVSLSGIAGALIYHLQGVNTAFSLDYRAHGTMGDPNFFSMHMAVSFFLALFYYVLSERRSLWVLPMMAIQVAGMVFSASRSGLLAFGASMVFLAVFCVPFRFKMAGLGAVLVCVLLFTLIPEKQSFLAGNPFTGRLATTTIDVTQTDRSDLWMTAVELFLGSPIVGVGYENAAYSVPTPGGEFTETHNTFLGLAAETGLFGLGVFLFAFLYFPVMLVKGARTSQSRTVTIASYSLIAAFIAIGIVGSTLNAENYRGFWLLMGVAFWFRYHYLGNRSESLVPDRSSLIVRSPELAVARRQGDY